MGKDMLPVPPGERLLPLRSASYVYAFLFVLTASTSLKRTLNSSSDLTYYRKSVVRSLPHSVSLHCPGCDSQINGAEEAGSVNDPLRNLRSSARRPKLLVHPFSSSVMPSGHPHHSSLAVKCRQYRAHTRRGPWPTGT